MKIKCLRVGIGYNNNFTKNKIYEIDDKTYRMIYDNSSCRMKDLYDQFLKSKFVTDYSSDWGLVSNTKVYEIY